MKKLSKDFLEACRKKLLELKQDNLSKLKGLNQDLQREVESDVTDQAASMQAENITEAQRARILQTTREIDQAIERMENKTYGICEETGDPIEEKRLATIPWARLSREGAELREERVRQESDFIDADEEGPETIFKK